VLIGVWVERSQPLAGTAATGDLEPRRFDGWLELLTVLSELLAAAPRPARIRTRQPSPARAAGWGRTNERSDRSGIVLLRYRTAGERDEPT